MDGTPFRTSFAKDGSVTGGASGELFCSKAYVNVLEAFAAREIVAIRIAWA